MPKLVLIFLLLFSYSTSTGNDLKKLIDKGLERSYNFSFESAKSIFNEAIQRYPDQPHGYHFLSQIYLWTFLGSKDIAAHQMFSALSDSARIKGEAQLERNENNANLNYLMGSIYTLRATSNSFVGSSIDAFWSAKSAVGYFENAIEIDPEFYDAYLGLGIFNYALSYVPGIFKWAVSLSGLSYDKEKGLQYLRMAQKKGKIDKIEASFHLAKIYTDYVAEYDSAAILLKNLIKDHPNNSLFHYQYAVLKIKSKELSAAEKSLNIVININKPEFSQTNSLSYFLMGDIYFKRNIFAKAISYFKQFIHTTKDLDYTGIANYRMAISYAALDSIENSKKHLLMARLGNLDIPDDNYAREMSEKFFIPGFSPVHLQLIQSKNSIDAGKSQVAYDTLKSIIDSIKINEQRGMASFYLSEAALNIGKCEEAYYYSQEAEKIEYETEKWVLPYSALISALANYELGNFTAAKENLDTAEDSNDFEFKDAIEALINNLSRKLSLLKL